VSLALLKFEYILISRRLRSHMQNCSYLLIKGWLMKKIESRISRYNVFLKHIFSCKQTFRCQTKKQDVLRLK
jgi:hypothetical protein